MASAFTIAMAPESPTGLPPVKIHHPHIDVRPDLLGGSPVVHQTNIAVRRLWDWHRKGVTIATLLRRYTTLSWSTLLSALAFAYDNQELVEADLARERRLIAGELEGAPMSRKVQLGWASKATYANGKKTPRGVAHYIDHDGRPACAKLTQVSKKRGLEPLLASFTCTWAPHEDRDHVCTYCRKAREPNKECWCPTCRVKPTQPSRTSP